MHVRSATLEDVPAIVDMSAKFYATTTYAQWAEFNPETVHDLASNLTENHVMLVAEDGGRLVGMVGLFAAPFMFNADTMAAYEVVWWVDPDDQGQGAGKALLAAIEPTCAAKGCKAIQMVHLSTSPPQAAAIYERMGYRHSESSYTRSLRPHQNRQSKANPPAGLREPPHSSCALKSDCASGGLDRKAEQIINIGLVQAAPSDRSITGKPWTYGLPRG